MQSSARRSGRRRYRSLFISDVHLGARACRAAALLDFLDGVDCERLYLLGDIVDGWRLRRRWFWPAAHAEVLERLLDLAREGVKVTYVPGNHDAFARRYCGLSAAGLAVREEAVHVAADGRRYLLAHGDAYDPGSHGSALARTVGDLAYRALMRLDGAARACAGRLGRPEASLAAWAKRRSVVALRVVAAFEAALAGEARRRGFDGVVCGHIHHPAARRIDGVAYVNCGDWVESFSCVAEGPDGALEVVRWRAPPATRVERRRSAASTPVWSA